MYHKVATNLPKEQRYNVAMIISAIGIARRELTNGRFSWDGELDALQKLYGADIQEPSQSTLFNLSSKLAADFRAGVFDESSQNSEAALNILIKDVLARLNEDSPHKATSESPYHTISFERIVALTVEVVLKAESGKMV